MPGDRLVMLCDCDTYLEGVPLALQPSSPAPSPAAKASPPRKTLLTACLLLLLNEGEAHGSALFGELRDRGISVEPSLAYRALHELQRDGAITSRWTKSDLGPQRRSYRLTAAAQDTVAELAARIAASCQQHDAFVRAHAAQADSENALTDAPAAAAETADQKARAPGSSAPNPSRELIAAWLLLLLDRDASYGYGLRQALEDRGVYPDPGALYRVLRKLEAAQWVQSRWLKPVAGPRRRLYRIRARGRRNRHELASAITAIRDSEAAFLQAYQHAAARD